MRRPRTGRGGRRRVDSWQVIYMDLMTIIMVFFVILWSINQRQDVGPSATTGDQSANMVSLPGDVLFAPGAAELTPKGSGILGKLFKDEKVLRFDKTGLNKRLLVIHGHTDADGEKRENFELGYQRAYSAFDAISRYSEDFLDHAVICTHADNSPEKDVPQFAGQMTRAERGAVRQAKAKNRRITIEDKVVSRFSGE